MQSSRQRRVVVFRRFRELLLKHCIETATPAEEAKLDRYQALRRIMVGSDIPTDCRVQYRDRYLLKELTRIRRASEGLPSSVTSIARRIGPLIAELLRRKST